MDRRAPVRAASLPPPATRPAGTGAKSDRSRRLRRLGSDRGEAHRVATTETRHRIATSGDWYPAAASFFSLSPLPLSPPSRPNNAVSRCASGAHSSSVPPSLHCCCTKRSAAPPIERLPVHFLLSPGWPGGRSSPSPAYGSTPPSRTSSRPRASTGYGRFTAHPTISGFTWSELPPWAWR